jgi:hypothetical protein
VIRTATLTLLSLLVGFSFSMAISRRDQRKNLEEAESNTIGTEYLWADLLAPADRAKVRELLKKMPRGPSRSGADKRGRISRLPRRARRFCRRSPRSWRFAATEKGSSARRSRIAMHLPRK